MKRNLLAMASACALLAAAVFTSPAGVMADTTDKITGSEPDVSDVDPDSEIGSTSVDTTVKLANYQDDVVYSITITAGKMIFNYDYGAVWDPVKHTYTSKAGEADGTWLAADLNGTNNKIAITNDSNYPISAAFSYSHNEEFSGIADDVVGLFDTDSKFTVDGDSDPSEELEVDIDMDTSKVTADSQKKFKYWTLENSTGVNKANVYFKYDGKPNRISSDTKTEYVGAGTITISISPASAVEVEARE